MIKKDHIAIVAHAHNGIGMTIGQHLPEDGDWDGVDAALGESNQKIHAAAATADSGMESAFHLHDAVAAMGKAVQILTLHSPYTSASINIHKMLEVAKEHAAKHEQQYMGDPPPSRTNNPHLP